MVTQLALFPGLLSIPYMPCSHLHFPNFLSASTAGSLAIVTPLAPFRRHFLKIRSKSVWKLLLITQVFYVPQDALFPCPLALYLFLSASSIARFKFKYEKGLILWFAIWPFGTSGPAIHIELTEGSLVVVIPGTIMVFPSEAIGTHFLTCLHTMR